MPKTVWFTTPIEYNEMETDSLVVERIAESETTYEFVTNTGETVTVPKGDVDRIE